MNILVTNNDGYLVAGTRILPDALSAITDFNVVASDRNKNCSSNSLTLLRPLRVHKTTEGYYSEDGTPTDFDHLAISGLLGNRPEMVVSGINNDSNPRHDVLYSGTFAAAIEGRYLGLPTIAVSLTGKREENYHVATQISQYIVEKLLDQQISNELMPNDSILNINVLDLTLANLQPIKVTRLGFRHKAKKMEMQKGPYDSPIDWVGQPRELHDAGAGADFHAIEQNQVSDTWSLDDLTRHESIDSLQHWLGNLQ